MFPVPSLSDTGVIAGEVLHFSPRKGRGQVSLPSGRELTFYGASYRGLLVPEKLTEWLANMRGKKIHLVVVDQKVKCWSLVEVWGDRPALVRFNHPCGLPPALSASSVGASHPGQPKGRISSNTPPGNRVYSGRGGYRR